MAKKLGPEQAEIPLGRSEFFKEIVHHLTGTLEEVVGLEDAAAFISVVGTRMGDDLGAEYKGAIGAPPWSPDLIARVLVDLKARVGGDFAVQSVSDREIVLTNRRCPFAGNDLGRTSLCMMTSNIFGRIVASATGYARVEIDEAIAFGDPGCLVRVHLTQDEAGDGHEFFH